VTKAQSMIFGLLALFACACARSDSLRPVTLDIEPQRLDKAIMAWSEQTGYQVLNAVERAASDRIAPHVKGSFTPEGALKALLVRSDLEYEFVNERTVTIRAAALGAPGDSDEHAAVGQEPTRPSVLAQSGPRENQEGAAHQPLDPSPQDQGATSGKDRVIDEVIVSAQKRSERLQDVPIPVTAVDTDSLVNNNQLRVQDYYTKIPGLSFTPGLFGQPFLVIRGITTGASSTLNPTVGIMVDEAPYGSSTGLGGGGFGVPDIDPSDLARVEVLRGPQGTLYGAASIGGLFKFVTVDPSTERFSGRLQAGMNTIYNGDELGHSVRGSVNVPLNDTLAIRASAYTRRDGGYIDDAALGLEGVNRTDVDGARVAMLWRPSDLFTLKLGALLQRSEAHGQPYVQPTAGDLQQRFLLRDLITKNDSDAYSATATVDLGAAELIAVSGYSLNKAYSVYDYTPFVSPAANQAQFGVSGTGSSFVTDNETTKFTQEIRLTAPIGGRLEALLGAFYTHEDSPNLQSIFAIEPATGGLVGQWVDFILPTKFTEYAVFADLTVRLTDRFDVQVGGRESWSDQTSSSSTVGPYANVFLAKPSPVLGPNVSAEKNAFTYLLTPRFRMSSHLMAYARLATGYRPGGPNPNATVLSVPTQFEPDKTTNYEIGMKGDVRDGLISFDASVYYIDWKSIQLFGREPVSRLTYYFNGSRAESQGVELSFTASPLSNLTVSGWAAFNEARLTGPLPVTSTTRGVSGDRLPYSPKWSGNLAIDNEFPLAGSLSGSVGLSVSYVGDRQGNFTGTGPRQNLPEYTQVDLNFGLKNEAWMLTAYANNVFDERGVVLGGLGFLYPTSFTYIQPRTIGVSVARSF
jgi:iron complex outermembrane recepter protein